MILHSLSLLLAKSWWLDPQNLLAVLVAALGLGFVIFVHELGHFLVAKACGVKCEKFYVGFDVPLKFGPIKLPSALFRKQWGETEYGIGIIPLGGYVKMLGQDDNPANAAKEAERIRQQQDDDEREPGLDPRSYPAKSVPQRMAIISAGVIMNLFFGVIFATIAYALGVNYNPCVVGSTVAGDPAWMANLRPGDKIIQLGQNGERSDHLRFRPDLTMNFLRVGAKNKSELLVRRNTGLEEWVTVLPSSPEEKKSPLPTIGVLLASTNVVAKPIDGVTSVAAEAGVKPGDRVVQVWVGEQSWPITLGDEVDLLLARFSDREVTLTIERTKADQPVSTLDIVLPPQPARHVGLSIDAREIAAVQPGSPADRAGLKPGDLLLAVDGASFDPLVLEDVLLPKVGASVTLTIQPQGESETTPVVVEPRLPQLNARRSPLPGPPAADSIGVALAMSDVIHAIEPDSPAAKAGLQPGDRLLAARLVPIEKGSPTAEWLRTQRLIEPLDFDEPGGANWRLIDGLLQNVPQDIMLELTVDRSAEKRTVTLAPVDAEDVFRAERGLDFQALTNTRRASSIGEALRLGFRETKEGVSLVFLTLRRITQVYTQLGGPGMIAVAATSEASAGLPRFLVFLTLLSANLAVLNFLPIPVLDGGHMMFLMYEGLVGKPVNERIAMGLTMLGLTFILGLMAFVVGLDVYRFGFAG